MSTLDTVIFKEEWQRPPQWRWREAMVHFANPYYVSEIKKDPYLYKVCNFYKCRKKWRDSPRNILRKYPIISKAFDCYADTGISGWKWYLEALLLTDASSKEISKVLHKGVSPKLVETYKKLFFDIDIYKDSERAIDVNVFGATREAVATYNNYDYTWKLIAYTWGMEKFLDYASLKKKKINKDIKKWFEEVIQDRVLEHTFHISSNMRLLYNESAIEILKTAQSFWSIADEEISSLKDKQKDAYLEGLLNTIDVSLQKADQKFSREEKREYYHFQN